eukprot:132405-Chlamydomonas_euryale.AAC.1
MLLANARDDMLSGISLLPHARVPTRAFHTQGPDEPRHAAGQRARRHGLQHGRHVPSPRHERGHPAAHGALCAFYHGHVSFLDARTLCIRIACMKNLAPSIMGT